MSADFVELCAHSWFSFGAGASSVAELVARAAKCEYPALGLTDVSNFCGALEFAQECRAAGIRPLTGIEIPVREGDAIGPVTFLAETDAGYSNLCWLASLAYLTGGRATPELDFRFLEAHADGVIALLGAPDGLIAADLAAGRWSLAEERVRAYRNRFGAAAVFLLLQQHLVHGDTERNRRLNELAQRCGVGTVVANAPWYHDAGRARLHDALIAIYHNVSLSEARRQLKVNANYGLLSPNEAARRFHHYPDALRNTVAIAERCSDFNPVDFVDGHYRFPDVPTPPGYDAQSWLERLCRESAQRRYRTIDQKVQDRLEEEFSLIRQHGLAGFFLVYHRIVELARDCMLELGYGHRETPLEWLPPGRGRGSSVSMLVGYLIGLSHVDPLAYGLTLDRFLSSDSPAVPWTFPGTSASGSSCASLRNGAGTTPP